MSLKSDENQAIKSVDLVFILAIAGRIDAQSRILAEKLDKDRTIYYAYSILDSLSSSYSMFKYFFDLCIPNGTNDLMHDMMMTPTGIIAISLESLFLVSFSFLATRFEKEKSDSVKKFIATAWPYFRDIMKGLKNAYKGFRSAVVAISLIGGIDLKYLIAPVGLFLGIFAAANRFWLRKMVEDRKVMMTANAELLLEIKKLRTLTHEESETYLKQMKSQSFDTRCLAFAAVAAGGFIDGLYLYVGVLGLAILSSSMLTSMAIICAIYTVACVVTRLYEEYDFQLRLFVTQTKCELALITKEMETSYAQLLALRSKLNKNLEDFIAIRCLELEVYKLITRFEEKRNVLKQQSTRTYLSAALLGIKNGLYAYSALASILFLVGSILVLTGIAFPPALLVSCVILGLVFMVSFAIHSLVSTYIQLNKNDDPENHPYHELIDMKNTLLEGTAHLLEPDSFQQSLKDGLFLDRSPQFFFQEWFEVFRSLFSGFGKGQKFVDFAGNPLQEMDDQGHYQDTPIMYVLSVFSALFFGIILALRALARGLGRAPLGQVDLAADVEPQPVNDPVTAKVVLQTEAPGESIQSKNLRTDSRKSSPTTSSHYGFFNNKSIKSDLRHAKSEQDFSIYTSNSQSTIQGLT